MPEMRPSAIVTHGRRGACLDCKKCLIYRSQTSAAKIITHRFIVCPSCGKGEKPIDHLVPGTNAGPWYCDLCGRGLMVDVHADGTLSRRYYSRSERRVNQLVLLRIPPCEKPIYLLVKGMRFETDGKVESDEDREGHKRYFYEEHTCPTNYLHDVVAVMVDGDSDPHGLAEYVTAIDRPAAFDGKKLIEEMAATEEGQVKPC